MIRVIEVKIVLLVLIGVVFFGCTTIQSQIERKVDISSKIGLYNKNELTKIVRVYFSLDEKNIFLEDIYNERNIFNIEKLTLNIMRRKETEKKKSQNMNNFQIYEDEKIKFEVFEGQEPFTHKYTMGISFGLKKRSISHVPMEKVSADLMLASLESKEKSEEKNIKASINKDGSVSLYLLKTNKKLLTIKLFKNQNRGKSVTILGHKYENTNPDSWLAITPEGYYVGSDDAYKYFGVDKYYQKFYKPEIVKLALQGKTVPNLPKMSEIKAPPIVKIFKKSSETNAQSITIDVKITPKSGGVGKIKVMNNGTAVSLNTRAFAKSSISKPFIKSYTIKLLKGKNNISVSAFEKTNSLEGEASVYTVNSTYSKPYKAKIHAIVLGVQEFTNSDFNLNNTRADAEIFTEVLEKQTHNGLFDGGNIVHLTTKEEKSKKNILKELEKMSNIRPEDVFVFYVGSHGEVRDGVYYLIPSNMKDSSTQSLEKDALSADELAEAIAKIQTRQKMIILDTCYAGKVGGKIKEKSIEENRGMTPNTATNILSNALKTMIFSASTSLEEANENYKGHGIFTYFIVKGLEGEANANENSFITTLELMTYVTNNVPEESAKVLHHKQNPVINYDGQVFNVARVQ